MEGRAHRIFLAIHLLPSRIPRAEIIPQGGYPRESHLKRNYATGSSPMRVAETMLRTAAAVGWPGAAG